MILLSSFEGRGVSSFDRLVSTRLTFSASLFLFRHLRRFVLERESLPSTPELTYLSRPSPSVLIFASTRRHLLATTPTTPSTREGISMTVVTSIFNPPNQPGMVADPELTPTSDPSLRSTVSSRRSRRTSRPKDRGKSTSRFGILSQPRSRSGDRRRSRGVLGLKGTRTLLGW